MQSAIIRAVDNNEHSMARECIGSAVVEERSERTKILCRYQGDLIHSGNGRQIEFFAERRKASGVSGVGLTHITDEVFESKWGKEVSNWSLSKRKLCRHKMLEAVDLEAEK